MVVIATGKNGARVLFRAEVEGGHAAGNVITRHHSMVEKIAQNSDPRLKQWNATLTIVQVILYLISFR